MNDMEEKRDNKEIRVRLHHIDRGNCTEVWEVQTEKGKPRRYLGRDDGYGPKEWYTVSIRFTTYFLEVFENIWDKIWRN